jgi:large subunit ribosomal protein L15
MQLHTLKGTRNKSKKRIGRGGKRGTTSGRGQKGQKSRAGRRIRPAARDLIMRMPKKRGSGKNKNRRKSLPSLALSLDKLQNMQEQQITRELLLKLRLLRDAKQPVKILASGTITTAKEISGIQVSKAAREKIEKAGGKIV